MSFIVGDPWIQSLRAGCFGDFLDFKSLMNWRNASTQTYDFRSAMLNVALREIPRTLFEKITTKNVRRLTFSGNDYNVSKHPEFAADLPICANYQFDILCLRFHYPKPQKLPSCCKTLEVDFLPATSATDLQQLCNMNPQITTLSFLDIVSDMAELEFEHIQQLNVIGCEYRGFFPQVTDLHVGGSFDSNDFISFLHYRFPCLKSIHINLSIYFDIEMWPTFSPEVHVYVSLEFDSDWNHPDSQHCIKQFLNIAKPQHPHVWFRYGKLEGNNWSKYHKYDNIRKTLLEYKVVA